jgi:hypothetical protein
LALFVILAGILLIIGGGISLLAGFDIVMTERGSAMTIGGTVALAGGTITLGIGFALLRLSQILRVLQTVEQEETGTEAAAEPAKTALHENVVTPAAVEAIQPDVIKTEPLVQKTVTTAIEPTILDDDTILISPLKPKDVEEAPKKPGFFKSRSKMLGLGVAGAAGTAILTSGAALADSTKDMKLQPDEPFPSEEDLLPPLPEISSPQMLEETPRDLEAELSRALAEDDPIASSLEQKAPAIEAENLLAQEEAKPLSFNEGLTQVLSKPKKRGKRGIPSDMTPDTAADNDTIHEEVSKDEDGPASSSDISELIADPKEKTLEQATSEDQLAPVQPDISGSQTEKRPAILGTYNAGDGTYVMYADGTVEAINEQGVRLFKSMEELRNHLAKT